MQTHKAHVWSSLVAPVVKRHGRRSVRRLSTPVNASQSPQSPQVNIDKALDVLPKFALSGKKVAILHQPCDFYDWLLDGIATAKRRIFCAALYLGNKEQAFIQAVHEALAENEHLTFSYVADALRSTRERPNKPCSADLLAKLKSAFPNRVHISLYHTPELNGWAKRLVPRRFDEGWGLWHAKFYGFDDSVMISGANLSNDYFTNRQDRYIVFRDEVAVADYFADYLKTSQAVSYQVDGSGALVWPDDKTPTPMSHDYKASTREAYASLQSHWRSKLSHVSPNTELDTYVRPFMQAGHLGIREETDLVMPFLLGLGKTQGVARIDWTSGYFSLDADNQRRLLNAEVDSIRVICASPEANGFFQSKGVSKYIPPAYTLAEKRFYDAAQHQRNIQVELSEWKRPGWTYHAKGVWLSASASKSEAESESESESIADPFATIIGSSNYGPRSGTRDMELNTLITTHNLDLQKRLGQEVRQIRSHIQPVDDAVFQQPDRQVGWGVRLAAWAIRNML